MAKKHRNTEKTQKGKKSQKDKTTKQASENNFVKITRNASRAEKPKKNTIKA